MTQKHNTSSNYHKNNYINVTGSYTPLVLQLCTVPVDRNDSIVARSK